MITSRCMVWMVLCVDRIIVCRLREAGGAPATRTTGNNGVLPLAAQGPYPVEHSKGDTKRRSAKLNKRSNNTTRAPCQRG
eukprot:COSAG06_NODE_869_length_11861_cov_37.817463_5_plen_80_part_00